MRAHCSITSSPPPPSPLAPTCCFHPTELLVLYSILVRHLMLACCWCRAECEPCPARCNWWGKRRFEVGVVVVVLHWHVCLAPWLPSSASTVSLHFFKTLRVVVGGWWVVACSKRPFLATECKSITDCEKWRREIIRTISKKVSEIQNGGSLSVSFGHRIRMICACLCESCVHHLCVCRVYIVWATHV